MLTDADRIRELDAVVKVPAVRTGWTVARRLADDGWPTLFTAVYTVAQAACAGSVGATYIAPYPGRLGDRGADGHELIAQMAAALAGTPTRPLVASVRTSADIARLVLTGVRHVTAAPQVIEACFLNEDSESDARAFATDAGGAPWPVGEPKRSDQHVTAKVNRHPELVKKRGLRGQGSVCRLRV